MNDIYFNTFGKRLAYLLDLKEINQRELADKLQISEATVSKYKSDRQLPGVETIAKIADILECSVDFLLCRSNELDFNIADRKVQFKVKKGEYVSFEEIEEIIKYANQLGIDLIKLKSMMNKK